LLLVVLKPRELSPNALLLLPVVLTLSAAAQFAVLFEPVVLAKREEVPLAVFLVPVVLLYSAEIPFAVLFEPVVLE
jgi:hypothetical protein